MVRPTNLINNPFNALFVNRDSIWARALYLGERIDTRALENSQRLGKFPLVVKAGQNGCAVLFRYGAVVLFGLDAVEEANFIQQLKHLIQNAFPSPEAEGVEVFVTANEKEHFDDNRLLLDDISLEKIQLLGDILAKSVVMAHYESQVALAFDQIEPLAEDLTHRGSYGAQGRKLLNYIGNTLLINHKMVGRVEILEKPELLWERPDLELLFIRLEDEFELRERHIALERKLELIEQTVETILNLLQNKRSLRVEWYIVILIVVEIILTLYEMFFRHT